ncbi:MAG: bifunctional nuclease family protein [Kiritimatiellia bacterium]
MIPVKVDQLLLLANKNFVLMLRKEGEERVLPIFIGASEAQAIALKMKGVDLPRPLTHDLLKNALDFLECRLHRVEVSDLKDNTFYARLILERDGSEMEMDSRPSDAIALALRTSAPIYVAEHVMDRAARVLENLQAQKNESKKTGGEKKKEALTPLEELQAELKKAVKEERYEEAAKLRDEIDRLSGPHAGN